MTKPVQSLFPVKSLVLSCGMAAALLACGGSDDSPDAPAPAPAPVATSTPLRAVTPLMQGWRFVQDDVLTDAQALASDGTNWGTVNLPHTWNATDAATTAQSTPST